jgi:signal peptidase II
MRLRAESFGISLLVFLIDQLTKRWIVANVSSYDTRVVVPGYFDIIHAENFGMAFSLLSDLQGPMRAVVMIGFAGAVMAFVAWLLWTWEEPWSMQRAALSLVLGGAMGNMFDRLARGSVTDFLDLHVGEYHWPTFNFADMGITSGALLIALDLIVHRKERFR